MTDKTLEIAALIRECIERNYEAVPPGVMGDQLIGGKWMVPVWGCDTLERIIDACAHAISRAREKP